MSIIDSTQNVFSTAGLATQSDAVQVPEEDQQADFLLLMTEQIKHQNPLKPLEGQDFLAQLAQFSTVDELAKLNASFDGLKDSVVSDQSLQAASLIGKDALVSGDTGYVGLESSLKGAVDMPAGGNLVINFYDDIGQLMRQLNMGTQSSGSVPFSWDGTADNGEWAGTGNYRIEALIDTDQGFESVPTLVEAQVESVSVGNTGSLQLNLAGIGPVAYSSVKAIK